MGRVSGSNNLVDSLSVEVMRDDDGGEVERSPSLIRLVEFCTILALARGAVIEEQTFQEVVEDEKSEGVS